MKRPILFAVAMVVGCGGGEPDPTEQVHIEGTSSYVDQGCSAGVLTDRTCDAWLDEGDTGRTVTGCQVFEFNDGADSGCCVVTSEPGAEQYVVAWAYCQ